MRGELTVRVVYPVTAGRIILRTDADWDANVEAATVSADGTRAEFHLRPDGPYTYFKPCLVDQGNLFWAQGTNYLGITNVPEGKDVYPFFYADLAGTITAPLAVPIPAAPAGTSERQLRVYQPPGYLENTLKRYPVLYMHDGKNLFFPDEAFGGQAWDVESTMDMLDAMNIIDKVLVVGIDAGDRMTEYTKPGYAEYGQFLVQRLKPFVDAQFRTLPGRDTTAVMGSSLGGVVSLYLGWQWADVFGKAACMSSTFGWQDDLLERVSQEAVRPVTWYLDSGWPGDNYEATIAMRDALLRRGYEFGRDLLYFAFPQALHNEQYWSMRSHLPFQFFFGKTPTFSI